jgi:alpha-ketoglutarate-dependent taurine dioxygenase
MKDRIADLSAYHSLFYSQAQIGHKVAVGAGYGFDNDTESPLRPLVKYHPVTRRPSLFIGRHAHGIPGLEPEESRKLLDDLLTFACQAPRTYEHQWRPGDVVAWDNRCLMHRARPYDHHNEARVMRHVRIAGDSASELVH